MSHSFRTLFILLTAFLVLVPVVVPANAAIRPHLRQGRSARAIATPALAITSIDTMKESRDTETRPLSDAQIASDVALAASLHPTYLTVDTHWDYPAYLARWVAAIRASGRHVWFRLHPNQWGHNNGTTGLMSPAQYEQSEQSFILANPGLFQPGDILDPCPEPENGLYWVATYGHGWTSGAPNAATAAYNQFIRATTDIADAALQQNGISGVITTIRSTNAFVATHRGVLEAATVARLGRVTVDSYPEGTTTDPATAAAARVGELNAIAATWGVPVVIGEMGYSNNVAVDDATQAAVLGAEFSALEGLPYLAGVNYWVGAGTDNSGGYTHLFAGTTGHWSLRPAATNLANFYAALTSSQATATAVPTSTAPANTATSTATATPLPPTATNTVPAPTATPSATSTPLPPTATLTPAATATPVRPTTTAGINVHINFQPGSISVYNGYLVDNGAVYGPRGNGYSYGWSATNAANTRQRYSLLSPDARYDTLIHMQKNGANMSWSISVPNGSYKVHLVAGDPDFIDSRYGVQVGSTLVVTGTPTLPQRWLEGTATITVGNGQITVSNAPGAINNKIDYIDIVST